MCGAFYPVFLIFDDTSTLSYVNHHSHVPVNDVFSVYNVSLCCTPSPNMATDVSHENTTSSLTSTVIVTSLLKPFLQILRPSRRHPTNQMKALSLIYTRQKNQNKNLDISQHIF
jgi:hypothetical protein